MPISAVAPPMPIIVSISIDLRPSRSPKWPKITPPIGLPRKPTVKVPSAANVPIRGSTLGKNSVLKTSAAAVP